MPKVNIGDRFTRLVVRSKHSIRNFPSGQRTIMWDCLCDCGNQKVVQQNALTSGRTKSCSCLNYEYKQENVVKPLFSPEDKDLENTVWLKHGQYARRKHLRAHRIVLERKIGRPLKPGELCDHINRNPLDNRRSNLRIADKSLNAVNTSLREDNSTGYRGVYKHYPSEHKNRGWRATYCFRIYRKGHKVFNSKYYKTAKEAHEARLEKLKDYIY